MAAKKAYQLKTHTIYCGDNLKMLNDIPDKSVDLIYIDPPFNSNRNYETFWGDTQQKRAFEDRFGDAGAYIDYMRPRIAELYRVLKDTGSFYYHCDWHASHYVKVMLDEIFSFNNFCNEIIWKRSSNRSSISKIFRRAHDTIYFYSKSKDYTYNMQYTALSQASLKLYSNIDNNGRYRTVPLMVSGKRNGTTGETWKGFDPNKHGKAGMHWVTKPEKLDKYEKQGLIYWGKNKDTLPQLKYYLDQSPGSPMTALWDDIQTVKMKESEGYPTQKPLELLERIINVSSNKGDVVLDAFCGCGTTLVVAEKLKRKWIGIDISPTACRVMADRLWKDFRLEQGKDFMVTDLPTTVKELRIIPHFEFEAWAVIALGQYTGTTAIPGKKVGDMGIDGKLYPGTSGKKKSDDDLFAEAEDYYWPVQVKQKDKAGRPDIDSFETAIRRDGRRKGYFVSFGYTEGAIKEIQRLDKEGQIEIIPVTVEQLMQANRYAA